MKTLLKKIIIKFYAGDAHWKIQRTLLWTLETFVILLGIISITIGYLLFETWIGKPVYFELTLDKYVIGVSVSALVAYYHSLRYETWDRFEHPPHMQKEGS